MKNFENVLTSAGEIFFSGLRGANNFFKRVSDRFSDPFSRFSNPFSYRFKSFSGAISFCRHAAIGTAMQRSAEALWVRNPQKVSKRSSQGSRPRVSKKCRKSPKGPELSSSHRSTRIASDWHSGRSHRRPNCSGSPNRRHFASLDLKKHPDFSYRRPTSQDFRRRFFSHFPVISDQANVFSHR